MSQTIIDLRSDTVTKPSPAMRQAIANAEVGDDVLEGDPTVRQLEKRVADLLGKEAAVFVASGTMANQTAIRAHTRHGDEILIDAESHAYYYECGGPAALSGCSCRFVASRRGIFTVDQLKDAIRPANIHYPRPSLVIIENTHNRGGGSIWPIETIAEVSAAAREAGLAMHLDGARLWNASVATGVPEKTYAAHFDSVSVCFSKGLGAPVGSALAGSAEFIRRARRFRKMFGGGMRQVGIIAAGALYALEHHRARLADDHANAKALAKGLAAIPGIEINPADVETNILVIRVPGAAAAFAERLKAHGVLVLPTGTDTVRAVTNLEVQAADIPRAIEAFRKARQSED